MEYNPYLIDVLSDAHLLEEMRLIGSTETGNRIMMKKGRMLVIRVDHVSLRGAHILKQEMLAVGGDAVTHKDVAGLAVDRSSMILLGTHRQFQLVLDKLKVQPFGLKKLGEQVAEVLKSRTKAPSPVTIRTRFSEHEFKIGSRTYVMGILNVTPDSFSDGGKHRSLEAAVSHALQMAADGADIIDVGGESTRPGHQAVTAEEEMERVVPIIERLAREVDLPISIDTYKASVAKEAIRAGAHIVNDIWGFKADPEMAEVCAAAHVPVILMHNRDKPLEQDLMAGVIRETRECVQLAKDAGIPAEHIWVDPGIGFGKTMQQNIEVMRHLADFSSLGYPVLLGTSRKSFIGHTLDLPVEERVEGTAATVALGIAKGAAIVRVHDVKEMVRVARMTDAMVR